MPGAGPRGRAPAGVGQAVPRRRHDRGGVIEQRGTGSGAAPAWFRALRRHPHLLAAVCAPDGTVLDASEPAVEGCGYTRAEVVGRPVWDVPWSAGRPEGRDRLRQRFLQVAAGGDPVRAAVGCARADGTVRTLDLTLYRVDAGTAAETAGEAAGEAHLLLAGLDTSDRPTDAALAERSRDLAALREVEAELSRALARSERVLANVADGIYGLDADGRVEFVNAAAVSITGYAADVQLGMDQHAVLHDRRPDGTPYPRTECPVWRALVTGRTVVADEEAFWRSDGTAVPVTLIAVPTVEDGAVTGVVVSFRDLTDRLAARRQADELARLSQRAAAEKALSDRLQQALLTPPPEPDHLHVVVRYRPAAHEAQVGGDWYDAFLQPDGATMLVVGDVVGHDSDAAAAMGQLRGLVRALAYSTEEAPADVLRRVERTARGLAVSTMATAVLARIERRPDEPVSGVRRLRWSNAGHLPPLLLHADGSTEYLATRPDLMLGIDPEARRTDHVHDLPDGSTLLLVTDGLVERRGSDLDEGLAALRAALADLGGRPLDELCDRLLDRLLPEEGTDDVALVAVRAHPEDRPRPPEAGPNRLPPDLG